MIIINRLRDRLVNWIAEKIWGDVGVANEDEMLREEMREEAKEYLRRQRAMAEQTPKGWSSRMQGWTQMTVDFFHTTGFEVQGIIEVKLNYRWDDKVQFVMRNPSSEQILEVKLGKGKVIVIGPGKTRTRTVSKTSRRLGVCFRCT